jgi:hypothetical protein
LRDRRAGVTMALNPEAIDGIHGTTDHAVY